MAKDTDIPGLGASAGVPRRNPVADWRSFTLSPTEGFVLSQVDGQTSYAGICAVSGQGVLGTAAILVRLIHMGAILAPGQPVPAPPPPAPPAPSGSYPQPNTPTPLSVLERLNDGSPVDRALLAQAPGLDGPTAERIARLHRRLSTLTPHQLLGVDDHANLAALKRAYFVASKELHPDRYYGREIGPFRTLLGEIFQEFVRAFEVLSGERGKKA